MYTDEQKTKIKNAVYALKPKKRDKILSLVSLLSSEQDDEMSYDVMLSYMDEDRDDELAKALADAQSGGGRFENTEERPDTSVPNRVKLVKDKK